MTTPVPAPKVTEAEFLELPTSKDHLELVDGEVIMAPSPTRRHQDVLSEIFAALRTWAKSHQPAYLGLSPLDVRLAPNRIVQPDLFLVLAGLGAQERPLKVVPDLCVEVLSERRSYDRLAKRLMYAEAGVREYWMVDVDDRSVEIARGLKTVRVEREVLTSPLLLGFRIELQTLWP